MVIAVFLIVLGILSFISKLAVAIANRTKYNLVLELIIITIGLSYLIWYCN